MLSAIGRTEADVHITNVVYWRPPGNRTPTPQEALACRPFLERQIELVAPKILVAVGGSAAKEMLGATEGIMRLRGKWREITIGDRKIPAIATLHPAYLLGRRLQSSSRGSICCRYVQSSRGTFMAGIDAERTFIPVRIAVLTMSDSRTLADDTSGDFLRRRSAKRGMFWPIAGW